MSTVCTAKASYKKIPGLLELTPTHLQWTQDGKKAPAVRVAHSEVSCAFDVNSFPSFLGYVFTPPPALFSSKEGAAQVRLKIGLENDSNGHNFAFTASPPLALTEREAFKAQLTTIISNNRAVRETGAVQPPQAGIQIPTSSSNGAVRRAPAPAPSRPSDSRAESVSSHRGTPVNDPINDFHVRKKVLLNTPELAALHRELVMSGQITETEFWEGREVCDTPTRDTPDF